MPSLLFAARGARRAHHGENGGLGRKRNVRQAAGCVASRRVAQPLTGPEAVLDFQSGH